MLWFFSIGSIFFRPRTFSFGPSVPPSRSPSLLLSLSLPIFYFLLLISISLSLIRYSMKYFFGCLLIFVIDEFEFELLNGFCLHQITNQTYHSHKPYLIPFDFGFHLISEISFHSSFGGSVICPVNHRFYYYYTPVRLSGDLVSTWFGCVFFCSSSCFHKLGLLFVYGVMAVGIPNIWIHLSWMCVCVFL